MNLSSTFPHPPQDYKLFTEENVDAYNNETASEEVQAAMRPPELPTAPYQVFGVTWPLEDTLPSLKESGVEQLYPDECDRSKELKKLARSVLMSFLEAVRIMGIAPEKFPPKLEHIRIIMLNMHHLINEVRPSQGRETLIEMMRNQLESRKGQITEMRASNQAAREAIDKFSRLSMPVHTNGVIHEDVKPENDDQRLFEILQSLE